MTEVCVQILQQKVCELKMIADSIGDERTSDAIAELETVVHNMAVEVKHNEE